MMHSPLHYQSRLDEQHKKVMLQQISTMTREDDINVDDTTLNLVHEFTYLGSIIGKNISEPIKDLFYIIE